MSKFVPTFNSTRCIRNTMTTTEASPQSYAFNSTRCIRNGFSDGSYLVKYPLSTPHGALGTKRAFCKSSMTIPLSTPHGALGTPITSVISLINNPSFNSTRCIRNSTDQGTHSESNPSNFQLHTVH